MHPEKLGFETSGRTIPSLEGLSAGQSTLPAIFGSILSYGDQRGLSHDQISGICLVDEIDAHMHVDLQHRALPALVKLFPKVQFIVSSHSPLFVLGSAGA
jgi:predicted ATP-dependent endonuclease of OLD family